MISKFTNNSASHFTTDCDKWQENPWIKLASMTYSSAGENICSILFMAHSLAENSSVIGNWPAAPASLAEAELEPGNMSCDICCSAMRLAGCGPDFSYKNITISTSIKITTTQSVRISENWWAAAVTAEVVSTHLIYILINTWGLIQLIYEFC